MENTETGNQTKMDGTERSEETGNPNNETENRGNGETAQLENDESEKNHSLAHSPTHPFAHSSGGDGTEQSEETGNPPAGGTERSEEIQESPDSKESMESFEDLFEKSMKEIKAGEIIQGKVVKIVKDFVMVDIGYKSEGQIPTSEFMGPDKTLSVGVGDEVEVLLEAIENEEGSVVISKVKADRSNILDNLEECFQGEEPVKGIITSRVKGGFSVDIGVPAFLPGSQVDIRPISDFEQFVKNEYDFRILQFNRGKRNIVLSRKAIMEKERDQKRGEILQIIKEGDVLKGVVKNITNYGVFIDLGGLDGLVHISDMTWGRIGHPSEMVKLGDDVDVKVLKFESEIGKVTLGIKQTIPDPWLSVEEKYPRGKKISAKVVNVTDYGVFLEIEEGVEGLLHVSEISWSKNGKKPSELFSNGDTIDVVVIDFNIDKKRISLSLKELGPNPWEDAAERHPQGVVLKVKVKNITEFGLFVEIDDIVDGLVHISDISWNKRIKHPERSYQIGQEIDVMVLKAEPSRQKFSLGIKQLTEDPWARAEEKYSVGKEVEGSVMEITPSGVVVELEECIEGLIRGSQLNKEIIDGQVEINVGDKILSDVISIDAKRRRIELSMRAREERLGISEAAEAIKATGATEVVEVPETTEVAEAPEATEVVEVPEATEVVEVPEATEVVEVPEATEVAEVPEATEVAEVPEATEVAEAPEATETLDATKATGGTDEQS